MRELLRSHKRLTVTLDVFKYLHLLSIKTLQSRLTVTLDVFKCNKNHIRYLEDKINSNIRCI